VRDSLRNARKLTRIARLRGRCLLDIQVIRFQRKSEVATCLILLPNIDMHPGHIYLHIRQRVVAFRLLQFGRSPFVVFQGFAKKLSSFFEPIVEGN
jgi:hypothetical protein